MASTTMTATNVAMLSRAEMVLPSSSHVRQPTTVRRPLPKSSSRSRQTLLAVHASGQNQGLDPLSGVGGGVPSASTSFSQRAASPSSSGSMSFADCMREMGMAGAAHKPKRWDVLGLGQAMVDFQGLVSDELMAEMNLEKGKRHVVDHEARGAVLRALDGGSYKVSAGGSLSNTLVALSRLGCGDMRVGLIASVGSDALGDFYRGKMEKAGVEFLSQAIPNGTTGTVVVLTTPDSHRTMLSYQGQSSELSLLPELEKEIACTKVLVVEGYLWEIPQTIASIRRAIAIAKQNGVAVALCTSDVSCVHSNMDDFLDVVRNDADMLFANADEACALAGETCPRMAAATLGKSCRTVSVTNGDAGSYIVSSGVLVVIPPTDCSAVDACGAGDAYAAGALFAMLSGSDVHSVGVMGSRVASAVVARQGARLPADVARQLATPLRTSSSSMLLNGSMNSSTIEA